MSKLVSILIPCYNAERWIAQAIQSALDQTWPNKEVIVVDDGSTDGSLEIIKSFGDRIQWETGPNRGGNVARNRLLKLSRGEWLQYLDADDYLLPEKISRYMETVDSEQEADIIFGSTLWENWWKGEPSTRHIKRIPQIEDDWVLLARVRLPSTGGPIWRRQAILDVGAWREDQPCCQEFELYSRLLMAGKNFAYTAHPGFVKRLWSTDTTYNRNRQEAHRRVMEIEKRIEQFLLLQKQLTPARIQAINETRFAVAREVWKSEASYAMRILDIIDKSCPTFVPRCPQKSYLALYHLLGFRGAQRVVTWKRMLFDRLRGRGWYLRNKCDESFGLKSVQ